jgi:hypothetical protein
VTVIRDLERSLRQLPEPERERLGTTFVRVIELLEGTSERLSRVERQEWFQRVNDALEGFARLVAATPGGGEVEASTPTVDRPPADRFDSEGEEPTLAELEKLNTANRFEQWRQAIRESFSAGELEAKGVSRQQLEQWRKRRKLIGLDPPFERGFFYPVWEFDEQARPHRLIPELIDAADEAHLDPLSLHRLMVSEVATPSGPLMQALKEGQHDVVLAVVRAAGAPGS